MANNGSVSIGMEQRRAFAVEVFVNGKSKVDAYTLVIDPSVDRKTAKNRVKTFGQSEVQRRVNHEVELAARDSDLGQKVKKLTSTMLDGLTELSTDDDKEIRIKALSKSADFVAKVGEIEAQAGGKAGGKMSRFMLDD